MSESSSEKTEREQADRKLIESGYRYALALCHDVDEAWDLAQEAFLKLCARGNKQPDTGYYLRTLRNHFIDTRRKPGLVLLESKQMENEAAVDRADYFRIEAQEVQEALAKLRPLEREVLYLSVVEEKTAREIAELCGHPRGTILSLLARARERLHRLLHKADGEVFHA